MDTNYEYYQQVLASHNKKIEDLKDERELLYNLSRVHESKIVFYRRRACRAESWLTIMALMFFAYLIITH